MVGWKKIWQARACRRKGSSRKKGGALFVSLDMTNLPTVRTLPSRAGSLLSEWLGRARSAWYGRAAQLQLRCLALFAFAAPLSVLQQSCCFRLGPMIVSTRLLAEPSQDLHGKNHRILLLVSAQLRVVDAGIR